MGQVDFSLGPKEPKARYRLMPLTTQYPDHPETHELLQQYKNSLHALIQAQSSAPQQVAPRTSRRHVIIPVSPAYMGEKNCLSCHPKQHQQWASTPHARAYQTLADQKKSEDPLCLAYHTTRFGAPVEARGNMKNVQCEACHGAAEGHPDMGRMLGKVAEWVCTKCHNSANSPNFDYRTYLPRVVHQK